jgi:quercetin dioxygenase-like cupin family protein
MPFYLVDEMAAKFEGVSPLIQSKTAVGEFMKVGIVTKPEGVGPDLHEHPNEEQFNLILEGQMHFILGDEDRIVGPGTLVHIPRNTKHRSKPVNGPCTVFAVKSPAGTGKMTQDYHRVSDEEAAAAEKRYPGKQG